MKKTYLYSGFLAVTMAATMFQGYSKIAAPPAGNTGAPGETTCSQSGCHGSNASEADVTLTIDGKTNYGYVANYAHAVKLKVTSSGLSTCGFQAIALFKSNAAQAGTFIQLSSDDRTFMTNNQSTNKKYMGHSQNGISCATTGTQEWNWIWETPAPGKGAVSYYVAVNEANGDGTPDGDKIAIKEFQLPERVGFNQVAEDKFSYAVYPAAVNEYINVSFVNDRLQPVSIQLIDLKGSTVHTFMNQNLPAGPSNQRFAMPAVNSGMYLVKMTAGSEMVVRKVVVE